MQSPNKSLYLLSAMMTAEKDNTHPETKAMEKDGIVSHYSVLFCLSVVLCLFSKGTKVGKTKHK